MKGFLSIFLVLTFTLYLGGIQLFYWIRIDTAKHEAVMHMQDGKGVFGNAIAFNYTIAQYDKLQWLEKNKEFIYNGQRYDINSIQYTSSGVIMKCYQDNEETEIAEAFQHFATKLFNTHQTNQSNSGDIMSKITKEYLPLDFKLPCCILQSENTFVTTQQYPLGYSPLSDIWHPPAMC